MFDFNNIIFEPRSLVSGEDNHHRTPNQLLTNVAPEVSCIERRMPNRVISK